MRVCAQQEEARRVGNGRRAAQRATQHSTQHSTAAQQSNTARTAHSTAQQHSSTTAARSPRPDGVDLDVGAAGREKLFVNKRAAAAAHGAGVLGVVRAALVVDLAEQALDAAALCFFWGVCFVWVGLGFFWGWVCCVGGGWVGGGQGGWQWCGHGVQRPAPSTQHAARSTQHPPLGTRHTHHARRVVAPARDGGFYLGGGGVILGGERGGRFVSTPPPPPPPSRAAGVVGPLAARARSPPSPPSSPLTTRCGPRRWRASPQKV